MAWDVEVNHYMHLVVVTLWGRVTMAERACALDSVLAQMQGGRPYRILVDMIGAHGGGDRPRDVEAHVERLAHEAQLRDCRVAYLYPAGARANADVERHADARALPFRTFNAVNDALDWLLAPAPRLEALPPVTVQAAPEPRRPPAPAPRRLARWFR